MKPLVFLPSAELPPDLTSRFTRDTGRRNAGQPLVKPLVFLPSAEFPPDLTSLCTRRIGRQDGRW
ncbi:hypothetical protein GCM10027456_18780 [Kineosporia babensis]